jgi:hypothetical protein
LHLSPPTERHISLAPPEQKVAAAISGSTAVTGACTTSPSILSGFWNKKKPKELKSEAGKWKLEIRKTKFEKRKWKLVALLADAHFPVCGLEFRFSSFRFPYPMLTDVQFLPMFFAWNDVFCPRNTVRFQPKQELTHLFSTDFCVEGQSHALRNRMGTRIARIYIL